MHQRRAGCSDAIFGGLKVYQGQKSIADIQRFIAAVYVWMDKHVKKNYRTSVTEE